MFIFNKNISFLRPRSVLSAVRPPLFSLCFCDCPLPTTPPILSPMGRSSQGLTSAAWTVPLWRFSGGRWGGFLWRHGAETKAVVRQSTSFLLALSLISWFRQGQDISTTLLETSDSVSVCRRVCNVYSFTWRLHMCVKSSAERDGYRKTDNLDCCCYLLYHTHTPTQLYFCPSVFSCSLQSTSSCCPPVGGAEVKSASQSFCLYLNTVFYYFSSNCL